MSERAARTRGKRKPDLVVTEVPEGVGDEALESGNGGCVPFIDGAPEEREDIAVTHEPLIGDKLPDGSTIIGVEDKTLRWSDHKILPAGMTLAEHQKQLRASEPSTADIRAFYDTFLPHLRRDHERPNPRIQHICTRLSGLVSFGQRVLDLGCGTGLTSYHLARLGAEVMAVDLSPVLIEFAREHSAHPKITYLAEDAVDLKLEGKGFDLIVLADVLEHIPEGRFMGVLRTVRQHSHDATKVYVNVPDARFATVMRQECPERLQIVDEAFPLVTLLALFGGAGFEAVEVTAYNLDCLWQYVDLVFVRREEMARVHENFVKRLKD